MTAFIGHKTKDNNLLPDINTPKFRPGQPSQNETDTEKADNSSEKRKDKIVVKRLSGSDIALSDRALAGLIDPLDKEEQRIEKLQQEVNEKLRGD